MLFKNYKCDLFRTFIGYESLDTLQLLYFTVTNSLNDDKELTTNVETI